MARPTSVAVLVLIAGGLLALVARPEGPLAKPSGPPSRPRTGLGTRRSADLAASHRPRDQALPLPGTNQRLLLAAGEVWLVTPTGRRSLDLARYHPWKLGWARVAGQRQLAVGVHKATRFEPHPHNALFLYDWDHGRLSPRWLGSRLSKPFTDFVFADLRGSGETELVSVERLRDSRSCLVVYRWTGFGFQGEWQSMPFDRMHDLTARGRAAKAWVERQEKRRLARFAWLGDTYGELTAKEKRR